MKAMIFKVATAGTSVWGFSEIRDINNIVAWVIAVIGVCVLALVVGFAAQGAVDQLEKLKGKWNGIGKQKGMQHSSG
jgi:hypothetical protein